MARVFGLLSDAALRPETWPCALAAMASATRSARGQILSLARDGSVRFNWVTDMPGAVLDDFVAIDGGSPDVNFRVAASASAAPGQVVSERDYARLDPRIRGEVYDDFCADYDIPYGMQTDCLLANGALLGIATLRTRRDGVSSSADQARFAAIVPRLLEAVRIQYVLEEDGMRLVTGALEATRCAAILLDSDGRIGAVTPAAERLLHRGTALRVAGGVPIASDPRDREPFAALVAMALARPRGELGEQQIVLRHPHGDPPLVRCSVITLGVPDWSLGFLPRAIVLLHGTSTPPRDVSLLQSAYGLTRAEAEIALAIALGHDRQEIARERGVATSTVLSQIKSLFLKTGVSREVALALLVRDLMG